MWTLLGSVNIAALSCFSKLVEPKRSEDEVDTISEEHQGQDFFSPDTSASSKKSLNQLQRHDVSFLEISGGEGKTLCLLMLSINHLIC